MLPKTMFSLAARLRLQAGVPFLSLPQSFFPFFFLRLLLARRTRLRHSQQRLFPLFPFISPGVFKDPPTLRPRNALFLDHMSLYIH